MKKTGRQFDVVPVAVALQTARLIKDDDSAVELFKKRCAPAGTEPAEKASPPEQSKIGEE